MTRNDKTTFIYLHYPHYLAYFVNNLVYEPVILLRKILEIVTLKIKSNLSAT